MGRTMERSDDSGVFECNYEVDCTPLYKSIELAEDELDYASILCFLETGKWTGDFEDADGASPEVQAKTWVTLFHGNDKSKIKWSQLPLHLAIATGAPAQVIASLVNTYPEALRCRDDQFMLPLHLALRYEASDDVIVFLLMQFPEAVNALAKKDRTTVECALKADDKVRGIMLDIFTEQTTKKVTSQMLNVKETLEKEIDGLKLEVKSCKAQLNDRSLELSSSINKLNEADITIIKLNAEISTLNNKIMNLENKGKNLELERAATESEWKEKIEKVKTEYLIIEVETQRKLEDYRSSLNEKEVSERKAREEAARLKVELEAVQRRVSEMKSPSDWNNLKREVEDLKAYQLNRIRADAKASLDELKGELEKSMVNFKQSDESLKNEMRSEIKNLKKNLDRLQKSEATARTAEELSVLRSDIDNLRTDLRDRKDAKRSKLEITLLKKAMEMELKNVEGKSKEEIKALKKLVENHNLSDLENKTANELKSIKADFEKLKKELKEQEFVNKTKQEILSLKASLEKEAMNSDSKTKEELAAMKKTVDGLQASLADKRSSDEIVIVKREVEGLKEKLKKKEESNRIQLEVSLLRKMVETELSQSQGKTQSELLHIKKSLKDLSGKNLENKNMEELTRVKAELASVQEELKQIEKVSKTQQELETLKQRMESEIKQANGKAVEELQIMKKALVTMNIDHLESKRLKKLVEDEIQKANDKAELELKQLKNSIEAIDFKNLETKNEAVWNDLHKEMELLKAQLKKKELDGIAETKSELLAVKQAVAGIDLASIEQKRKSEYDSIKSEIETLKLLMQAKETEEMEMKTQIKDLKKMTLSSRKRDKTMKNLLATSYMNNHSNRKVSDDSGLPREKIVDLDVFGTILPPRLLRTSADVDDSSSESSERHVSRKEKFVNKRTQSMQGTIAESKNIRQMILDLDTSKKYATETMTAIPLTRPPSSSKVVFTNKPPPSPRAIGNESRDQPDITPRIFNTSKSGNKMKPFSLRKVFSADSRAGGGGNGRKTPVPNLATSDVSVSKNVSSPKNNVVEKTQPHLFRRTMSRPVVSSNEAEVEVPLQE